MQTASETSDARALRVAPRLGNVISSLPQLRTREFFAISRLVYRVCGIHLHKGKRGLVQTRLVQRITELGLGSFGAYLERVQEDASGQELRVLIDLLTTNKTGFFREQRHFDFLRSQLLSDWRKPGARLRIWSAGCSSGEEPYSIGMLLRETCPDREMRDVRILATDISSRVLRTAREGVYSAEALTGVSAILRQRHFLRSPGPERTYRVRPELRQMIHFAHVNLIASWPMRGPFDVIFCRNVMIYFDAPTKERLVQRIWDLLNPGGYFFTGHSESLNSLRHRFHYVQPAVYRK